jgi:class 3 adenylate cyclase
VVVTALSCPNCGNKLRRRARFCDACGLPIRERHPASGATAPIDYTPQHLVERILAEQAAAGVRAPTAGERKLVTALFADIADSTALIQQRDPEEVRGLIDPVLAMMMEAVHHYEGYVAKSLGDGILALFGAPIAHEDHPQRAVYAALRMQESVQRYAERLDLEPPMPLRIRVGIHTGEVLVRTVRTDDLRAEYDPVGRTVHLAARMEGLAAPGRTVVSEVTHRLVEDYFEFRALGAVPVKGVAEAVSVHEVLGAGPLRTRLQVAVSRGLAPFVGRQAELDRLSDALAQARDGRARVVGVVGEPGVGKSRLFLEFRRRLPKDCRVLETFSVSNGKSFGYLP